MSRRVTLFLFGPAVLWAAAAAGGVALTVSDESAWADVDRRESDAVGSQSCRSCHPGEFASWHQSFHRTMTQDAVGEAVLAPFAGETVEYLGFVATLTKAADGRPHVRIAALDDEQRVVIDADVTYTVGSHRYQQYLARLDRGGGPGEVWRLPVAWHIGEQRWIHMNGAFVEPDGVWGSEPDYLRHLNRWNDNCIFCHTTEPVPGYRPPGVYESSVAELGIACEACHGRASAHVGRHQSVWRRVLARTIPQAPADGSVAHPRRLPPARESAICGRCHGQRIGRDIDAVLREGDQFVPGTDLAAVSRPIFRDSTLAGQKGRFVDRFWPDGTPRLSAYEYQALLLSPCHAEGEPGSLGCGHCHDMHGDDPNMQLRDSGAERGTPAYDGCSACHRAGELSGAERSGGHGGHGTKVSCEGCHMPRTTYGLLEGIISHRITTPDPGAWVGRHDQPDACTQCHVEHSRAWASEAMAELGLGGTSPGRPDEREAWASRVVLDLFGGDPLQRNLAAHTLARPESVGDPSVRMAALAVALEDEYASVRWFAWRGLRDLASAAGRGDLVDLMGRYDYLGDAAERIAIVTEARDKLVRAPMSDHPDRREWLELNREDKAIWIGE